MVYRIKRKGIKVCKECFKNKATCFIQTFPICQDCRQKIRWGNVPVNIELNPEYLQQRYGK